MPTQVWILSGEYNVGSRNGETNWIEGVFATQALAEAAQRACLLEALAEGELVWEVPHPPLTPEELKELADACDEEPAEIQDRIGSDDWTISFPVTAHEIQEAEDAETTPAASPHWLLVAHERISAGEPEAETLSDYGWQRTKE